MAHSVMILDIEGPSGPLNPALNVWHFSTAMVDPLQAACQLLAFTSNAMIFSSINFAIQRVRFGSTATAPLFDLPFPGAEVTAYNATAVDPVYECPITSYGTTQTGVSTNSAPIGTSVLITEYTELGGRHNGRKYLPWVAQEALSSSGQLDGTVTAAINDIYEYCVLGRLPGTTTAIPGPGISLVPVAGSTDSPIYSARCSPNPARLRSRMR